MKQIKRMNRNMFNVEKKIQKNQMRLKDILEEINIYSYENDRKSQFLATAGAFRSVSTNCSKRENPRDLLRASFYKTDDYMFTS